jgi:hypothetical protein
MPMPFPCHTKVASFLAALIAVTLPAVLSSDTAFALYPDRIVRIVATVAEAGVPARWR